MEVNGARSLIMHVSKYQQQKTRCSFFKSQHSRARPLCFANQSNSAGEPIRARARAKKKKRQTSFTGFIHAKHFYQEHIDIKYISAGGSESFQLIQAVIN